MHIVAFVIALIGGAGYLSMAGETLTSTMSAGAGIGSLPLPMMIACAAAGLLIAGGYMAMKRKQYARTVLWVTVGLFIAAYALDPQGLVFSGDEKQGLAHDDVLGGAFFTAVAAGFSHFDAHRQKIKQLQEQLEDKKAKGES